MTGLPTAATTTAVWDGTSASLTTGPTDTTSYSYDNADQLTNQTDPAGHSYSFTYDSRGNLQGTQYPNSSYRLTETNAADGGVLQDRARQLEVLPAELPQLFRLLARQQITPAAAVGLGLPHPWSRHRRSPRS